MRKKAKQKITIGDVSATVNSLCITVGDLSAVVNRLSTTVGNLSTTVTGMCTTVGNLSTTVNNLYIKVENLEVSMDKRFDELLVSTKRGFDEQTENLDQFKDEMRSFRDRTEKKLACVF